MSAAKAKKKRPEVLKGWTHRVETPLGTMYVNITEDDNGVPLETFVTIGKAGAPLVADAEAIGRLMSLALRYGAPIHEIHRQLRGISSDRTLQLNDAEKVLSMPDAVAIAIEKWLANGHKSQTVAESPDD